MGHTYSEEEIQEMEALAHEAERKRAEDVEYAMMMHEMQTEQLLEDDMISTEDIFPSSEEELWMQIQRDERGDDELESRETK